MAAIDYQGIRDEIQSILEGDSRTASARIYVEEEPQFGLSDVQQAILVYFNARSTPAERQTLSAGTRMRHVIQVALAVLFFSMESYRVACNGRDELLGKMELVMMGNRTLNGKATTSWIEGGEFYSVRNPAGGPFVAIVETALFVDVTAVNP